MRPPRGPSRYYSPIINEIESVSKNHLAGKPVDHVREGYRAAMVRIALDIP